MVVLLASCTPQVEHDLSPTMGCQPETVVNAGCQLSETGNNAELFGRDYEGLVETELVSMDGVSGFLAKPIATGKYPGVVMIHEWWGLNENIKEMAQLLAAEGYVVFAVDLYDGNVASTSEDAGKYAGAVRNNQAAATEKLRAAVHYLRSLPEVSGQKVGSIGWCFGGGQSLQLALSGEPMDATVIYYGTVTDDKEQLSQIGWPVLGIFAGEDTSIPPASVNAFKAALDDLGIENDITIYPGVGHAFANPSGQRYAPEETKDAWSKTVEFFDSTLK
jgi:carboxymethylenebutenolidase